MHLMFLRRHSIVTYAVWVILIGASIWAFALGDWMIGAVGLATLGLSIAPAIMAERLHLQIPVYFYAGIVLFLFGTVFLGEAFDFYERFWWWDLFLHATSAVGFGIVGVVLTLLMFEGDRYAAPAYAVAGIAFAFAVTIGVTWEIFEYAVDQVFGFNMQKSGLDDTMTDLMVDCLGAALGAASGYAFLRGRSRYGLSGIVAQFVLNNRRYFRRAAEHKVDKIERKTERLREKRDALKARIAEEEAARD
ncbi:MAG: hypothetical protein ACU0CY_00830 [Maritimibacter harenae]|jgi:hypothetical protein